MIKPINNNILVKVMERETLGNVYVPEQYNTGDGFEVARVVRCSKECNNFEGQQVLIPVYDGVSVVSGGQHYVLISSSKIVAIITE